MSLPRPKPVVETPPRELWLRRANFPASAPPTASSVVTWEWCDDQARTGRLTYTISVGGHAHDARRPQAPLSLTAARRKLTEAIERRWPEYPVCGLEHRGHDLHVWLGPYEAARTSRPVFRTPIP